MMRSTSLLLSLCLASFALLLTTPLYAQDTSQHRDIVYLKDGSTIRGVITEYPTGINLQVAGDTVFVYPYTNIQKYVRVSVPVDITYDVFTQEEERSRKDMVQLGYHYGTIDNIPFRSFGADIISAYRLSPHFVIGLGLGVRNYQLTDNNPAVGIASEFNMIPIFSHIEFKPFDADISPYISFGSGYLIPLIDSDGGWLLAPRLGLDLSPVYFAIGVEWKRIFNTSIRAVSLQVGISF